MCRTWLCAVIGLATVLANIGSAGAGQDVVNESARAIPIAYSVDVLVVGGSTGAVAAAAAAAKKGTKVFLAVPRSYLGDDMTATLRLWLEEGEKPTSPLGRQLFDDASSSAGLAPEGLSFSYQTDRPSAARHRDTSPPSLLADRRFSEPSKESVQYDDDVNITVDLHEPRDVGEIRLWAFQSTNHYRASKMTVSASSDQKQWEELARITNCSDVWESRTQLAAKVGRRVRYLKLLVQKSPTTERLLLGEIEVIPPLPDPSKGIAAASKASRPWPRPMHVKRTLDDVLLKAGVQYLYNCYPTEVLHDAQGRLCGIVMANRAGRQAVLARWVIDATDRAVVARMAGATFRPFPAGRQVVKRVVIGGRPVAGPDRQVRLIEPGFTGLYPNQAKTESGRFPIIEYTFELPVAADSDAAWAKADQEARTRTYHPDQQFTSDTLFQVPPDPMIGQRSAEGPLAEVADLPLEAFQPKGLERLLVLGGCADVSRPQAEKLLRPLALIDLGSRLGEVAALQADTIAPPSQLGVRGQPVAQPAAAGDVRELLDGIRPVGAAAPPQRTVSQEARALPVLGCYDVVVIGGGTAGAPAGIAAARQGIGNRFQNQPGRAGRLIGAEAKPGLATGCKTLVVEQLCGLGGVGTLGAISSYCQGNRVGFTAEVAGGNSWVIEQKMEWWRSELLKAGAEIWFGSIGCGALVDSGTVRGAVVVTPRGRGVVLAKVVVDATGNADVAAAAGAKCQYTDQTEFAIQGTGLPPRELGAAYRNSDFAYTDDNDIVDVWHLLVYAKDKYPAAFDLGKLVDTRERRRIVGDATLTVNDIICQRTYPDSIAQAQTGYDTHGYIVDPFFLLRHPMRNKFTCYVPYRCLLPKGLEHLLVTGIGLSAHRDAQPIVRMQPDIQNQGYAAGAAAAMAAMANQSPRQIDVRELQRHLVEIGNLPRSVLTEVDSFPLPDTRVAEAVARLVEDYRSLAVILAHRDQALPLLVKAYRDAPQEKKLAYSKALGMMGDPTGLPTLLAELQKAQAWDTIPDWRMDKAAEGADRVGWSMSHLDNTLAAIGRTGSVEALPEIFRMMKLLTSRSHFSHHRAVYLALEWIGDPRAARSLAEMLQRPEMHGHAVTSIERRGNSDKTRQTATRELALARALYRCGDWKGLGEKTLREYAGDLRGHFARHARSVLAAGKEYRVAP